MVKKFAELSNSKKFDTVKFMQNQAGKTMKALAEFWLACRHANDETIDTIEKAFDSELMIWHGVWLQMQAAQYEVERATKIPQLEKQLLDKYEQLNTGIDFDTWVARSAADDGEGLTDAFNYLQYLTRENKPK